MWLRQLALLHLHLLKCVELPTAQHLSLPLEVRQLHNLHLSLLNVVRLQQLLLHYLHVLLICLLVALLLQLPQPQRAQHLRQRQHHVRQLHQRALHQLCVAHLLQLAVHLQFVQLLQLLVRREALVEVVRLEVVVLVVLHHQALAVDNRLQIADYR